MGVFPLCPFTQSMQRKKKCGSRDADPWVRDPIYLRAKEAAHQVLGSHAKGNEENKVEDISTKQG